MGNAASRAFARSKQEVEIRWQGQKVALSVNSLGTTRFFLADSDSLCQKTPLAFGPIPFSSVAFVSTTWSGPRQKSKIDKICVCLPSSQKCGTGDSGVSSMREELKPEVIILRGERKNRTLKRLAYSTNLHKLPTKPGPVNRLWRYKRTSSLREQSQEAKTEKEHSERQEKNPQSSASES